MPNEIRRILILIGGILGLFIGLILLSTLIFDARYDYTMITVASGGAVLGTVSGVLGCFAVLRRESLIGDTLAHAALPGVAIAFLIAGRELSWLLLGAGIAGWLGVNLVQAITKTTRIKADTAMGLVLSAFFAFGLALLTYIQKRPDASQAGLDHFIFGQAAAIGRDDIRLISVLGLINFGVLGIFWKEFKLITFDPEFARANGFPLRFFEILLSTLTVIAIVLGLQVAGVILMVGILIAPAVAARQWTQQLDHMVLLAAVFGAFSGASGAIISGLDAKMPTGPLIIVVASGLVFFSLLFATERGLLWTLLRQRQDRQRFAAQLQQSQSLVGEHD